MSTDVWTCPHGYQLDTCCDCDEERAKEMDSLRAELAQKDAALREYANSENWTLHNAQSGFAFKRLTIERPWEPARAALSPSPSEAPAPPAETLAARAPPPPDVLVAALSDLPPHTGKLLWSRPIGAPLPIAPPPDSEAEARIDALVAAQPKRGNRRPLPAEPAPRETAEPAPPNVAPRRHVSRDAKLQGCAHNTRSACPDCAEPRYTREQVEAALRRLNVEGWLVPDAAPAFWAALEPAKCRTCKGRGCLTFGDEFLGGERTCPDCDGGGVSMTYIAG